MRALLTKQRLGLSVTSELAALGVKGGDTPISTEDTPLPPMIPSSTPDFAIAAVESFSSDVSTQILAQLQGVLVGLQAQGLIGAGGVVKQAIDPNDPTGNTLLPLYGLWMTPVDDATANAELVALGPQILPLTPGGAIFVGIPAMQNLAQALWVQVKEQLTLHLPPTDTAQQLFLFFETTPGGVIVNHLITVAGWGPTFTGGGGVIGFGDQITTDGTGGLLESATDATGYVVVQDPDGQVKASGLPDPPQFFNPGGVSIGNFITSKFPSSILTATTKTTLAYRSVDLSPEPDADATGVVFGLTASTAPRVPKVAIRGPQFAVVWGATRQVTLLYSAVLIDVVPPVTFAWKSDGTVQSPTASSTNITFDIPVTAKLGVFAAKNVSVTITETSTGKTATSMVTVLAGRTATPPHPAPPAVTHVRRLNG